MPAALAVLAALGSLGSLARAAEPTPKPNLPGVLSQAQKAKPKLPGVLSRSRANPTATPAPTLADVLARAKAASENATSLRGETEEWELTAGGLTGTETIVRRGHDFVAVTRLGPFTTQRGRNGRHDWHQDENGLTVLDRGSAPERITGHSLERVSEPVDAYAVAESFANGHVRRSYYDPKTYVLVRREKWAAGRFSYTTWDDFRPDTSGRLVAWHQRGDDGYGNAFDDRLRRERAGEPVEDAALTIPHNRRTVVEFPPTTRVARLPARFERHRILVRVTIARRPLEFLIDSGASGIVIAADVARSLGLQTVGSGNAIAAGSFASERAVVPLAYVGGLRMRDLVVHTAPLMDRTAGDARVAGLLGYDFLAGLLLRIDYERETVDAYEPGAFSPPASATTLEVNLADQVPATQAAVGDAVGEEFLVDTGAATSLLLFERFARAHPADVSDDGVGAALAQTGIGLSAYGVGGRIGTRPVLVKRLRFGGVTLDDPLVYVAESPHALGVDAADGLVGADVLARLGVVVLDYPGGRILVEPR